MRSSYVLFIRNIVTKKYVLDKYYLYYFFLSRLKFTIINKQIKVCVRKGV
jgi:hypothetical protein